MRIFLFILYVGIVVWDMQLFLSNHFFPLLVLAAYFIVCAMRQLEKLMEERGERDK